MKERGGEGGGELENWGIGEMKDTRERGHGGAEESEKR